MGLNHYAINQVVGGKMVPAAGRFRFGHSGAFKVASELLKHRPRPRAKVEFDLEADRKIFDAFLLEASGHSPETVLIDPALAAAFHARARKLGVHASSADINRRILNIRKNKARYAAHGLVLPKATAIVPQESIVPRYAHIIEFSLARLHSRYGVSIDDILIDPELAAEYEQMAHAAAPELSPVQLRLAALYIRKTRYIEKAKADDIQALNTAKIEVAFETLGTLDHARGIELKPGAGLVELLEDNRHLYISRNDDLPAVVHQMASGATLQFMANDFWTPDPRRLVVRVLRGAEFQQRPVSQWQLKLISEKHPVFNWPVKPVKAA